MTESQASNKNIQTKNRADAALFFCVHHQRIRDVDSREVVKFLEFDEKG
jgi:hypothetical protein